MQVTRDGEKLPYQGMLAKRSDPSREEYVTIEPGAAASAEVDLRMGYDLSVPAPYQVQFTAGLQDVTDDASLVPQKRDQPLGRSSIQAVIRLQDLRDPAAGILNADSIVVAGWERAAEEDLTPIHFQSYSV